MMLSSMETTHPEQTMEMSHYVHFKAYTYVAEICSEATPYVYDMCMPN